MYRGWPWEKKDIKVWKVSFCDALKFEKVTGSSNNAEANIAGITPAQFILNGKWEESPP